MPGRAWRGTVKAAWTSVRHEALVAGVLVLALLGTWVISRAVEQQVVTSGMQAEQASSRELAALLADRWHGQARQIAYLQSLAGQSFDTPPSDRTRPPDAVLRAFQAIGDGIEQIAARDAAGRTLWSLPSGSPVRPAGADDPVSVGTWQGHRTIAFTTRHNAPDGSLLGSATVAVNAELSGTLAQMASLLRFGIVMLVGADGAVLSLGTRLDAAHRPAIAGSRLRDAAAQGHLDLAVAGPGHDAAWYFGLSPVAGTDLIVAVGMSQAAARAPVDVALEQVHRWALALCLVLVVMAFAVNMVFRRTRSLTTARRNVRELHQRQTLLREIAETASDLIIILDARMCPLFINPAYRTLLGADPEAATGKPMAARILPEDFEQVRLGAAAVQQHGGSWRGTFRARHEDGSIRWLESEIVSVRRDGTPNGPRFVSISRDVTRRIEDEAALRSAQAALNALVRLGPGSFYRVATRSATGEAVRWFPAGSETLEIQAADPASECRFRARIFPADRHLLEEAMARCLETGDATAEYRFTGPNQALLWIRDRMRLVQGSPDEQIVFGYIVEITQEREDMGRLRQIERLATLGEVAAGVAHEMNQPLAAIAMAAENGLRLLDAGANRDLLAAKLTRVVDHAHRLSLITDAVCLFGRTDAGSGRVASFDAVMTNLRVLVKPRLTAADARLTVDVASDLPLIRSSPVALEQALMNLVVNACDAYAACVPQPAAKSIRLCCVAEAGQVRITVADEAGGIADTAIDRIFNPFFTTKPPGQGTGLGLSISYMRIAEMGGRMSARNHGGGAVFEIVLPIASPSHPADVET